MCQQTSNPRSNLVPRAFSLAWGRGRKRPWHRLVTYQSYTLKFWQTCWNQDGGEIDLDLLLIVATFRRFVWSHFKWNVLNIYWNSAKILLPLYRMALANLREKALGTWLPTVWPVPYACAQPWYWPDLQSLSQSPRVFWSAPRHGLRVLVLTKRLVGSGNEIARPWVGVRVCHFLFFLCFQQTESIPLRCWPVTIRLLQSWIVWKKVDSR